MRSFHTYLTEQDYSHILKDSLTHPGHLTWEQFSHPPALPSGPLYLHITSITFLDSILREGLLLKHSTGRTNREPTVIWTTHYGDKWGGGWQSGQCGIVISASDARRMGSGVYVFQRDITPREFILVERPGFSEVSTGSLTVREERLIPDADERRLYYDAYKKDTTRMGFREWVERGCRELQEARLVLYRGEYSGNKGGRFFSPDKEFARQFTQSGQDHEIRTVSVNTADIYDPPTAVYAGDPDAVDVVVATARSKGFKAVWLSEGPREPRSVYVFNRTALGNPTTLHEDGPAPAGAQLFHKDVGIPAALQKTPIGLPLKYSNHARKAASDDRITRLPARLPPNTLIEVEAVEGRPTKWVVRFPTLERQGWDMILVVQPDGFVRTMWMNARNDSHRTLKTWLYTNPTEFKGSRLT
jgi:hypothetical protein